MGTTRLNEEQNNKRCLILGGGEIKSYAAVAAQIGKDDFILCADSGFLHCKALGISPDLLVGDMDSIGEAPENIPRLNFLPEKDYTDSTLAVQEAVKRGYKTLLLAGMLGGRFDHSIANLQTLNWCVQNGIKARITDGVTEIHACKDGEIVLEPKPEHYFSVFSLSGLSVDVSIRNGKYPLDHYDLGSGDPRAVSNEFAEKPVRVTVKSGALAIIVTPKQQLKAL